MQFSDWQLNRLRKALGAFHDYGHDNKPYNWQGVVEAFAENLGADVLGLSDDPAVLKPEDRKKRVKQHAERLRQFVEGYTASDGVRSYPRPQPELLDAIVRLLTKRSLLSPEELREFQPDWQAAMRLLEYLDQDLDAERLQPPSYLEGTYEGERRTEEALIASELTLQRPSKQGLIQAVQIDRFYDPSVQSARLLSAENRAKARTGPQRKFGGWAILTPEDTLLLFMKDARHRRNHYFFSLASDLSRATEQPVTRLTCLYHDYALEPDDGGLWDVNMLSSAMVILMENNIVYFNRVEGHADS